MCGIAVIVAPGSRAEVESMLDRLSHRGPDDSGVQMHRAGGVWVGHNRLSIIDPEGGQQPFVGNDGAIAVSNGEIYNHRRLVPVDDPARNGSGSDAAVLLPMFREFGTALFDRLDGMYAIVIVAGDGTVVAARDRLGIKPLYRATRGEQFAYASELKSLPRTRWDHIETVRPGHVLAGDRAEAYYRLPEPATGRSDDADPSDDEVEHWCRELRDVLERAVVKRLMSDAPLGTFLSGGLDSSIITALASRHVPELSTFALGFEGSADLAAAQLVADYLGTRHHAITVPESAPVQVLPEVLYHLESWDRDLVRSALPNYLVARFAATELKVVLTGEGADELFAGYKYHGRYIDVPDTLQRELHRSVGAMHNSNLQRVDRMTMAHSLEARVPFLDPEVVALAMRIPARLKLRRDRHGPVVEKWILRMAFADVLPPEIVWRTKSQFDEGSGAVDRLRELASTSLDHAAGDPPHVGLRDVEEAWYFRQLVARVPDWQTIRDNTSVWTQNRIPVGA
jgi:asparagine synthase (glutamine-hydrolysing)